MEQTENTTQQEVKQRPTAEALLHLVQSVPSPKAEPMNIVLAGWDGVMIDNR
jgi:hypothetical protein